MQRLQPGAVIKLTRRMDDGQWHEKRFVVLHVDEETVTCVINSSVSRFIRERPALLRCQVAMAASNHGFMEHDSVVDCSHVRSYESDDVIEDLAREPRWYLGRISPALRDAMLGALKYSPTLPPSDFERYGQALAAADLQ